MNEVRNSGLRLLNVDSNQKGGGGTTNFYDSLKHYWEYVREFPDDAARNHALHLIESMGPGFKANTPGSWRPFIVMSLQAVGINEGFIVKREEVIKVEIAAAAFSESTQK